MLNLKTYLRALLMIPAVLFFLSAQAQDDRAVMNNCKTALKVGNSKDLARHFNDIVELSLDGESSKYSKTQAEFVLKDFFKKYPPVDFQFSFQGSSPDGLKYAIGKYAYSSGSFRVYILIKEFKGIFVIDTLSFSKE